MEEVSHMLCSWRVSLAFPELVLALLKLSRVFHSAGVFFLPGFPMKSGAALPVLPGKGMVAGQNCSVGNTLWAAGSLKLVYTEELGFY